MQPKTDAISAQGKARIVAGFTLLELLVAMAVFAIVSVSVYAALSQMLLSRSVLQASYSNLADMQRMLVYLERDIAQAVARPAKGPYGDKVPALHLVKGSELSLTRTGAVTYQVVENSLLRVRYRIADNIVQRAVSAVLDQAQDSRFDERQLLSGITVFELAVFDQGNWYADWPPTDQDTAAPGLIHLPQALRIRIQTQSGRVLQHRLPLLQSGLEQNP
ncbi:MAG: type II secretion system minor pseudopilin GspJ [Pseudomonadota bacterium]